MRILHVIWTLDPNTGGPPAVVIRLAAAQARLGNQLSILSYGSPESQARVQQAFGTTPGFNTLSFHTLPGPDLKENLIATHATAQLRSLAKQIDVIHIHGVWTRVLVAAGAVARSHNIPYVVAPHGMLDPWSLTQSRWKKTIALALGHRRLLDQSTFLHVLNVDEGKLIQPLRLSCPTVTIPNGVFLEEIDPLPQPGSFRKRHPELEDDPYILFLSRLHRKKGLDILAHAFAQVAAERPNARLVVAGPDDGDRAPFEQMVRELRLEKRTHLVGPLYGQEKMACLVDAACFCLPSRQEGFSMAITEALASRIPVVISEACHFPEVAEAQAGHVVPLNAESVASALIDVLSDPAKAKRQGEAGRELVASKFTWPQIAQTTQRAYESHSEANRSH